MNRKQYVSPIMERIIIASQPMLTLSGDTNGNLNIGYGGNASEKGVTEAGGKFWDDDDDWDE